MRMLVGVLWLASALLADEWPLQLAPGARVEVAHGGKIDHGIYAMSNANEIVITTRSMGQVSIPLREVERVVARGVESQAQRFFANVKDQLFPPRRVVYERSREFVDR